jgi:hypothetical protein
MRMSRAKVVVGALLAALVSSVVLAATAGTAGAAVFNMVIPAGHQAVLALGRVGPTCPADQVAWGYNLDSKGTRSVTLQSNGLGGCTAVLPNVFVGPFLTDTSIRIFLTDFTIGPAGGPFTFYSNSTTHTLMTPLGPTAWGVDMRDSFFGTCGPTCVLTPVGFFTGNVFVEVFIF